LTLSDRVKDRALSLGFHLVGIAPADPLEGAHDRFVEWLSRGYQAGMGYMDRHAEVRRDVGHPGILSGAKSVVVCAMGYGRRTDPRALGARVASYARGRDYHNVLPPRLRKLARFLRDESPGCRTRVFVDTAPLLEKAWAMRAGIGWIGKNACLLHPKLGSRFVLGEVVTDVRLEADSPHEERCGSCRACLDACPTGAFPEPFVLDARRCLAYWTIEHHGPIPEDLREPMGDRLFGCDDCQDVCPFDRKAPDLGAPDFATHARWVKRTPADLLALSDYDFAALANGSPMARPGRSGMLRNAAIVLGNTRDRVHLPVLRGAVTDADPVIRDAANWAIERIEKDPKPAIAGRPRSS